jgi:uncharacterized membrane protein
MPFKIGPLELVLMAPMALVGLAVYFLPAIFAVFRRHANALAIFLIDLLLGWTVLGWIGALVWALATPGAAPATVANGSALEIARERYARGEISSNEFNDIKQNLGS